MRCLPSILASAVLGLWMARANAQVLETNGVARIEAEATSTNIPRLIGGVTYAWTSDATTPGFSGMGYLEARASDGTSTNTVTANWQTASPQVSYSVNFANTGTYYVWVRGYAGDATSAGLYVGLDGVSPATPRIDMAQYNTWSWANTAAGSQTPVSISVTSAGTHTLNVWMRDSGLDLDRIILTRNPNFSPAADPDFWRNQNIYQIITDRFFNGDTTNDSAGLPNFNASNGSQAHGGDFKGIEQKLDYIKALGATAIWISPVVKNANGDYHGYAATDFYTVNPRMGTLADLQRLIREAQKRGILVINDVVVNHGSTWVDSGDTGWPTFRYPPSGYNLRYNSGGQQYAFPFDNTTLSSVFGNNSLTNIFHNNGATANWSDATQVEYGELASLDDFRTESAYVRQKMQEIWTYWMDTAGFDAFRLDTVKHVGMDFWDSWSPAVRAAAQAADKPNFFQFGEVFDGSDAKCGSYTGTKSGGNYKMESVIDYPLYYQIGSVFGSGTGSTGQIESRYGNLTTNNYDASALDSLVLNLDNHDNPRFLNTTGSSTARLELALVFMYTSRGIPSLYYGTEQDFNGGADPNNREDMFDGSFEQGPSLGDNFNMTSARFRLVAKLNNLRRIYPALRTGSHVNLWANFSAPGLLAYARRLGTEEAYVVINTATTPQTIGARPTIHPVGTVLVDVMNPTNTLTVTAGTDGIPSFVMPATSYRIYVAQSQWRTLSPVVAGVSPAHDAASISPAAAITVSFSQGMNTNTVQSAFSTAPASTGAFTWASNNTVMTYTPSSNLGANTLYAVRIDSTAADTNGSAVYAPFESRFTTGAAAATARPSINSVSSSGITDTGATLSSAVTPNGAATTVFFDYGTTTNYGTTTAGQAIGTNNSPVNVNSLLGGLAAGTVYNYRVHATNSAGETFSSNSVFTTASPLPQVTTTPATFVGPYGANINGDVNPNGLATSIYFEWGDRSDVLSNSNTPQAAGSGTNLAASFWRVESLTPDTTYFFRAVATSVVNTLTNRVYGATLNFHTAPVKPTVTTLAVSNAGVTNANLAATVNPNGSDTVFYFEYGTNNSAPDSVTALQPAGSGTNSVQFSSTISGLIAGRNYFYRGVASNSFGVSYGAMQSFSAGLPPPSAVTLPVAALTGNSAQLVGTVEPNNSPASAWFEWGTTTNYGSSSRAIAVDDAESYSNFNFTSPNNAGGSGFGNFSRFSAGTGAGTFLAVNSSNQTIDGSKTFGAYGGSGSGISFRRPVSTARQFGSMTVSARFNVDNSKGFTGFNLKSTNGSGSSGFGAGELVSFGISPGGGNNGIAVTDSNGTRVLDLGADVRNAVIDFKVDFDASNRRYVLGAKFRANDAYVKLDGPMSGTGTNVTYVGFANWNGSGSFQDLMFDSLQLSGSVPLGGKTGTFAVTNAVTSLATNTVYHYRVASMNLDGGTAYGADSTFYTGTDLSVTKSKTGAALVQGGAGEFVVTVSNVGAAATSGTVTVAEQPPQGMTVTSMSGSGWTFNSNNLTATRSNSLAAGTNFPPITITVAMASNAPTPVTNSVTVTGGGDGNTANNSAAAAANVTRGADLIISKATNSAFQQGGGGSFVVTVSNIGGAPSSGTVTVTEQPPPGMTVTAMSGDGWAFDVGTLTCTRADALAAGASYPPLTVAVTVPSDAAGTLTNSATVSGGGDVEGGNNTAQAAADIAAAPSPIEAWRTRHFGTAADSGRAADAFVATDDGMPNLLKYALGLDPTNAAPPSRKPALETFPPLAIKFLRAKDASDVTLSIEAADGMEGAWTNIWSSSTNAFGGGTNASEEVIVKDPATNAIRRYLRLKVTRP